MPQSCRHQDGVHVLRKHASTSKSSLRRGAHDHLLDVRRRGLLSCRLDGRGTAQLLYHRHAALLERVFLHDHTRHHPPHRADRYNLPSNWTRTSSRFSLPTWRREIRVISDAVQARLSQCLANE